VPRITRSVNEITNLRCDLQLSGYPQGFIDSVINCKGSSRPNKEEKPLGSVYIPYVMGSSQMFKHMGNRYNNRIIFKTKHAPRSSRMRIRVQREPKQRAHCVFVAEATLAKQADL
jgi:hypothetical protein